MDKQTLRNQMKTLLVGMTDEERNFQSNGICNKIISLPQFRDAGAVYLYYPLKTEPDTAAIFSEAIRLGKRVAYPVITGDELEFRYVSDFSQFKPGALGTKEPDTSVCPLAEPEKDDRPIIVVPGLAFDKNGRRLGRGRGFYDRYLQKKDFALTIGCFFKGQLLDCIPYEEHDEKVSLLWN